MQYWLGQEQVQQGGVVGLNNKKKDFFDRNAKESRADDGSRGIAPDSSSNQIRIPWRGGDHGDLKVL